MTIDKFEDFPRHKEKIRKLQALLEALLTKRLSEEIPSPNESEPKGRKE